MKVLASLVVFLVSLQAHAHIIPSGSVARRFANAQAMDKVERTPLVGSAVVDDRGRQARGSVSGHVAFPGECAFAIEGDVQAQARLSAGRVTADSQDVRALAAFVALGCPLTTLRAVPAQQAESALSRANKALGVDTRVVSLRRLNGRTAWAVGARARDSSSPQVWFDKQSQRPVRVIGSHDGALWDVRFRDPRSMATGRAFPRIVEVWQGERRVLALHLRTAGDKRGADDEPTDEGDLDASED